MRSFDELITHLLEEVALCGERGANASDIERLTGNFYDDEGIESSEGTNPQPGKPVIDQRFLRKVWQWLANHPDVRLENIQEASLGLLPSEGISTADSHRQDAVSNGATNVQGTSQALTTHRNPSDSRIHVSQERIWHALAGHGVDHRRVPPLELELLSFIAQAGPKGILQPHLTATCGQDKRSVPKRTDALAAKGYIEKSPALMRKHPTSLLTLKRFIKAKQVDATPKEVEDDKLADLLADGYVVKDKLLDAIMALLDQNKIIVLDDLKRKFKAYNSRWEAQFIWRTLRDLETFGLVQRVRARVQIVGGAWRWQRCVKYVRMPTEREKALFVEMGARRAANHRQNERLVEAIERMDHVQEQAEDDEQDEDIEDLPEESEQVSSALLKGTDSPLASGWTPNHHHYLILHQAVQAAGIQGIHSVALCRSVYGLYWRRPFDNMMGRLTDLWHLSQPPHLKHMAIIRDTSFVDTRQQYLFRTYENFDTAVRQGLSSWEAVTVPPRKGGRKKKGSSEELVELDEWGFPKVTADLLNPKHNVLGTLKECIASATLHTRSWNASDAMISVSTDGKESVNWGRGVSDLAFVLGKDVESFDPNVPLTEPKEPKTPRANVRKDPYPINRVRFRSKVPFHFELDKFERRAKQEIEDAKKNARKVIMQRIRDESLSAPELQLLEEAGLKDACLRTAEDAKHERAKRAHLPTPAVEVKQKGRAKGRPKKEPKPKGPRGRPKKNAKAPGSAQEALAEAHSQTQQENPTVTEGEGSFVNANISTADPLPETTLEPLPEDVDVSLEQVVLGPDRADTPKAEGQDIPQVGANLESLPEPGPGERMTPAKIPDQLIRMTVKEQMERKKTGGYVNPPGSWRPAKQGRPPDMFYLVVKSERLREKFPWFTEPQSIGLEFGPKDAVRNQYCINRLNAYANGDNKRRSPAQWTVLHRPDRALFEGYKEEDDTDVEPPSEVVNAPATTDAQKALEAETARDKTEPPATIARVETPEHFAAVEDPLSEEQPPVQSSLRDLSKSGNVIQCSENATEASAAPSVPVDAVLEASIDSPLQAVALSALGRPLQNGGRKEPQSPKRQISERSLNRKVASKSKGKEPLVPDSHGTDAARSSPTAERASPDRAGTDAKDTSVGAVAMEATVGTPYSAAILDSGRAHNIPNPQIGAASSLSNASVDVNDQQPVERDVDGSASIDQIQEEPAETPQKKKHQSQLKVGVKRGGGSLAYDRGRTVLEIVNRCGGVFPGGRALHEPYNLLWQAKHQMLSDWSTIGKAINNLESGGKLQRMYFTFKDRKGNAATAGIYATMEFQPDSPEVQELLEKIKAKHPRLYIPPESGYVVKIRPRPPPREDGRWDKYDPWEDDTLVPRHYTLPYIEKFKKSRPQLFQSAEQRGPLDQEEQEKRKKMQEELVKQRHEEIMKVYREAEAEGLSPTEQQEAILNTYSYKPRRITTYFQEGNAKEKLQSGPGGVTRLRRLQPTHLRPQTEQRRMNEEKRLPDGVLPKLVPEAQPKEQKLGVTVPQGPRTSRRTSLQKALETISSRSQRRALDTIHEGSAPATLGSPETEPVPHASPEHQREGAGVKTRKARKARGSKVTSSTVTPKDGHGSLDPVKDHHRITKRRLKTTKPAAEEGSYRFVDDGLRVAKGYRAIVSSNNADLPPDTDLADVDAGGPQHGELQIFQETEDTWNFPDIPELSKLSRNKGPSFRRNGRGVWSNHKKFLEGKIPEPLTHPAQIFYTTNGTFSTDFSLVQSTTAAARKAYDFRAPDAYEYADRVLPSSLEELLESIPGRPRGAQYETDQSLFERDIDRVCRWELRLETRFGEVGGFDLRVREPRFINHPFVGTHVRNEFENQDLSWDGDKNQTFTLANPPAFPDEDLDIFTVPRVRHYQKRTLPMVDSGNPSATKRRKQDSVPWPEVSDRYAEVDDPGMRRTLGGFRHIRPYEDLYYDSELDSPVAHAVERPSHTRKRKADESPNGQRAARVPRVSGKMRTINKLADAQGVASATEQEREKISNGGRYRSTHRVKRERKLVKDFGPDLQQRLMVAVTVVRVLTGGLGHNIRWDLTELALKSYVKKWGLEFLEGRYRALRTRHRTDLNQLIDEFQQLYGDAYEKNEVPPIDFNDLHSYPWEDIVNWMLNRVNGSKTKPGRGPETIPSLPHVNLDDAISTGSMVKTGEVFGPDQERYFHHYASIVERYEHLLRTSFALPFTPPQASPPAEVMLITAKSWLRATALTPDPMYMQKAAYDKLALLPDTVRKQALTDLLREKFLRHVNKGRQVPGRNYDVPTKFLQLFERQIGIKELREAVRFKTQTLDANFRASGVWRYSYHIQGGEQIAVTNLMANGLVKIIPKLPPIDHEFRADDEKVLSKWGLMGNQYQTRSVDKGMFHWDMDVRPTSKYTYGNPISPLPDVPGPGAFTASSVEFGGALHEPIPIWLTVHGQVIPTAWDMLCAAVLSLLVTRSGIDAQGICKVLKDAVFEFEIQSILEWMEKAGVATKEGSGWTTGEWWWLCLGG